MSFAISIFYRFFVLSILLVPPMAVSATELLFFDSVNPAVDSLSSLLYQADFKTGVADISHGLIDSLVSLASGSDRVKARSIFYKVRGSQIHARPSECIELLDDARRLVASPGDYDRALINYQLAGNLERMGQYVDSYQLIDSVLPVFETKGDYYFLGNSYLLLGQLYLDINDMREAESAIGKAKDAYEKCGFPLGRIWFFKSYVSSDEDTKSLLKRAVNEASSSDYAIKLQSYSSLVNLFLSEFGQGDSSAIDSAAVYSHLSDELLMKEAPDNKLFTIVNRLNAARINYAKNNFQGVLDVLDPVLPLLEEYGNEMFVPDIYLLMSEAYENMGKIQMAYHFLKLYDKEMEGQISRISMQTVSKIKAAELILKNRSQISILRQKARADRNMLLLVIALIVLVTAVSVFLAIYFRQRSKLSKIENARLKDEIDEVSQHFLESCELFENNLRQQESKISTSNLLLVNKNAVLKKISDLTEHYYSQGKVSADYVTSIESVIKESIRKDSQWGNYSLHFDNVHPGFFVKLKQLHPDITENELKLCAYLRIGLSAKQIAEMLSVSPASVNTSRYRLRKKLGLDKNQSLDDYIRSI